MSDDLREPPAKKRKSRFGPQPSQDKPNPASSSSLSVTDDLVVRQQQALAVAASLSKQLGLDTGDGLGGDMTVAVAPPSASSFLQTASLFANKQHSHHHQGGLGYGSRGQQHEDRVFIPKDDYPDINFIGLILGPKGLNQKRMQSETGCRILVKGQGSSKNGVPIPDSETNEPLHVYVSADTKEKVELGVKKINDLIRESTEKYDEGGMEVKVHRHSGYIDVEIPNTQIGVVIGKQSQNIRRIQDTTGAFINISASNIPENPLMKMITISGTNRECEDALIEIHRTIEELRVFRARLQRQRQHGHQHAQGMHYSAAGAGAGAVAVSAGAGAGYQSQHFEHRERMHALGGGGGGGGGGGAASEAYGYAYDGYNNHHSSNRDASDNSHHRDYGTATYDPNFAYPDCTMDESLLPTIASGAVESGLCEIEIPSAVVGLIIGKNASNVKSMKDRTRCDIRVQKDEETLPQADIRLVALKGCVQSIKAAREEIAKVIQMANTQKQGATLHTMHQQNYQQMMQYQNQMQMYQQMMYQQQQLGYGGCGGGQYAAQYPAMDAATAAAQQSYYAQWQQQQQQADVGQTQTANATGSENENANENDKTPAQTDENADQTTTETQSENAATAEQETGTATADGEADKNDKTSTCDAPQTAEQVQQQQQQYQQMMQSYGWTPQQIASATPQQIAAAYQQYPQWAQYQQYYQQYAQQYPQWAQYQASMQAQQMQQQQQTAAPPPPPPPPPPEDSQEPLEEKEKAETSVVDPPTDIK